MAAAWRDQTSDPGSARTVGDFAPAPVPPLVPAAGGLVGIAEKSVRFHEAFLGETRARAARGEATQTDVAMVEARLAAARARLAAALGGLAVAREDLRAATGRDPD